MPDTATATVAREGGDRVEERVVTGAGDPALRGIVDDAVGYRMAGFPAGVHRGLPSAHVTLVASPVEPVDIAAMPDPGQPPSRLRTLVGGLHSAPVLIRHAGHQHGVHLRIDPFATRALFGVPAAALANTVVDLRALWGRAAVDELEDRLTTSPTLATQLAALQAALVGRLEDPRRRPAAEVARAWRVLTSHRGQVDVDELAREAGWSRRHLAGRFRDELGLPPKRAARVLRFQQACELLREPDRPDLATVAASCGYYDQAHLNRDWRDLAGCPPGEWLRTEVDDTGGAPGTPPPEHPA